MVIVCILGIYIYLLVYIYLMSIRLIYFINNGYIFI